MEKIELFIIALVNSESHAGNYSLILEEQKGFRRLPVIIGPFEAQAIAVALERMGSGRPMTHDLFQDTLEQLGINLREIIISEQIGGVFHALMIMEKPDGAYFSQDARTSDAIALAVRFNCPIYTTPEIMAEAGVILENPAKPLNQKRGHLSDFSREELAQLLEQVLEKEDYESAVKIRNAMEKKV